MACTLNYYGNLSGTINRINGNVNMLFTFVYKLASHSMVIIWEANYTQLVIL